MTMFQKREGCSAITVRNGLFNQSAVYVRDDAVFVSVGAGFARVYRDGSTSVAKLRVDALHLDFEPFRDGFGRVMTKNAIGRTRMADDEILKLGGVDGKDA